MNTPFCLFLSLSIDLDMESLFLLALAGMFNAAMDSIATRYSRSVFSKLNPQFWNPEISWENMWLMPLQPSPNYWYYFGHPPPHAEAFPYSSTIFSFLTDGWHLCKFLMLWCIAFAVATYSSDCAIWFMALLSYCSFTLTFTIFYVHIFNIEGKEEGS